MKLFDAVIRAGARNKRIRAVRVPPSKDLILFRDAAADIYLIANGKGEPPHLQ